MISYYELLGMIKDKTNPKKVKFDEIIFEWNSMNYVCNDIGDYLNGYMHEIDSFEKNIEIIEENKDIEELKIEQATPNNFYITDEFGTKCLMPKHSKIIAEKVNEIIKTINEIQMKESEVK